MIRIVGAGKQQHDGECHRHLVIIVMVLLMMVMLMMLVLVLPVMVLVRTMPVPRAWHCALADINSVVERQEFPVAPLRAARRRLRPIAFAV